VCSGVIKIFCRNQYSFRLISTTLIIIMDFKGQVSWRDHAQINAENCALRMTSSSFKAIPKITTTRPYIPELALQLTYKIILLCHITITERYFRLLHSFILKDLFESELPVIRRLSCTQSLKHYIEN